MSNSTVDARLSLILMLWEKVSEKKRNWISLTEMNRHTLSAPLLIPAPVQCLESDYV